VLDEQQAIVSRYASALRAAACGRQPAAGAPIHCYALVNRCALELSEAGQRRAAERDVIDFRSRQN
jgi:hypothetical protein